MHLPQEPRITTRALRVRGLVQGVGFRPTVWRLACEHGLSGDVCNDGEGVLITARATPERLDAFVQALFENCPPLGRIDAIEAVVPDETPARKGFHIRESRQTPIDTAVAADAATCPACLAELHDTLARRHRYAFTNCTHCGPRLSIVQRLPYDRTHTSMSAFEMCEDCRGEYNDPADRRFHAQPIACPACGPRLLLYDADARPIEHDDPLGETARRIRAGEIVAIKGLGGIHLACDATQARVVERLRRLKHRPHKPLALMARDLEHIKTYCRIDEIEASALAGPAAPIVLLEAREGARLPHALAPDQKQWGFMLPYTPVHHLLMEQLQHPIVLSSGNRSDEPQCTDNEEAFERLNGIAEAYLLHDRPIVNRIDDSVVHRMGRGIRILRRARGYAPGHIPLPPGFEQSPPVLAMGGELKNTFCLLRHGHAVLSQHIGDLEEARTYADYRRNLTLYADLYQHEADLVAVDAHPEYLSSKLGREWGREKACQWVEVQHHHAHIAACMADNGVGLNEAPLIGIALDGLGMGDDGTLWGAEFLLADYRGYRRLAHLKAVPLPGGTQALREPWRNTFAQLHAALGWANVATAYEDLELTRRLKRKPLAALEHMITQGINSPMCSSAGRLFDALAWAIGLTGDRQTHEGQAAMALEAGVEPIHTGDDTAYPFDLDTRGDPLILDPAPCWRALLDDLRAGATPAQTARRFHHGLAKALVESAVHLAQQQGVDRIALSGGVFQNRCLFERVSNGLRERSLKVLTHHRVPANDGGLSLGQALVAAARQIG